MKRWLTWMMASCVLVLAGSFAWIHRRGVAVAVAAPATKEAPAEETYAEVRQAREMVSLTGPVADYMLRQKPNVETLRPILHKTVASDHVGGSPVGTSSAILHKTFGVADIVNLPFEVPAHASNPQLRGTYRSFQKQTSSKNAGDGTAGVEFLVLNERQYGEFISGQASEAVFSADAAQEVATSLPPTLDEPAKYHLVFRNSSHDAGGKLVQADFRIDF